MKLFYTIPVFFSLAVLLNSGNSALAQNEVQAAAERERQKEEKADQKKRWETILESIRGDARDMVIRHLEVVISEIARSSSLDEAQKTKLAIGAKGAADKAVEEWAVNLERQQGLIQQLEAMAANQVRNQKEKPDEGEKQPDDEKVKEAKLKVDFDKLITQWGRQIQPATAEKQAVWTATLDKTLSKEQKSAWETSIQQRAEFGRSLQVAQAVQAADNILRFTNDQRQKFFDLLNESDPKEKGAAKGKPNGLKIRANGGIVLQQQIKIIRNGVVNVQQPGAVGGKIDMQKLDREELAKFLSDEQIALWDDVKKNPRQIRNNNLFFGNLNGVQVFNRGNIELLVE